MSNLATGYKERVTPIFDVIPRENRPLGEYLDLIARKISDCWTEDPVICDLYDFPLGNRLTDGTHPVSRIWTTMRALGVTAVPCTGLDRDAPYNEAVKSVVNEDNQGLVVRLQIEDIETPTICIPQLETLLERIQIETTSVDLLFDLREIILPVPRLASMVVDAHSSLANIGKWRTNILAGSRMPRSLAELLRPGQSGYLPRSEFEIWSAAVEELGLSMRYGDYGVVTPDFSELENPQLIVGRMGPNARYTLDNRWFVTRGRRFQTDGYDQYYTLAEQVASLAEFSGRTFSFGDEYIDVRANGNGTTGNPTTWIAACMNHHLTYVADQIDGYMKYGLNFSS